MTLPFDGNSQEIPIVYQSPVYGVENGTFLDFVAPGIICSIIYFQSVGLTTLSLVMERKVNKRRLHINRYDFLCYGQTAPNHYASGVSCLLFPKICSAINETVPF